MIFFRKGVRSVTAKGVEVKYDLEGPINQSVFPGHQGGPHNHTITALATALKAAATPEFIAYQKQVISNSSHFADAMTKLGYSLVSGGTENHLQLIDLKPNGIDGARVESVLEMASIALNKNTVPGDKSAFIPGGIRMGTPALTSRGFTEADFEKVAEFVDRAVQIAQKVNSEAGPKRKDFMDKLDAGIPELTQLRTDVEDFAASFPTIGFDKQELMQ